MSAKKLPKSALRIDARFSDKIAKHYAKWKGKKPNAHDSRLVVAAVAQASIEENTSAFRALCASDKTLHPGWGNQPRSTAEHWVRIFLEFPDFTLSLMKTARTHLAKYDALDRTLYRISATGTLDSISDGDLILQARKAGLRVSDDMITKRRQRWTALQRTLDEKAK